MIQTEIRKAVPKFKQLVWVQKKFSLPFQQLADKKTRKIQAQTVNS